MDNKKLFQEFPATSTQDWKDKIIKDLKGADYDKKLVWKTGEGFNAQPFYRGEDIQELSHTEVLPGEFPYLRGNRLANNQWLVRQDLQVKDLKQSNKKALDIRMKGVDSLGFVFENGYKPNQEDLEKLLNHLRADVLELNFTSENPVEVLQALDGLAKKYNRDLDQIKGSVNYDPLGQLSVSGSFKISEEADMSVLGDLFKAGTHLPNVHRLTVNADVFHNAGSGIVSEMAFALASASQYMQWFADNKYDIDQAAASIRFHFSVGSNYFMEVAKFRALRFLWSKIANAFGISHVEHAKMFIHCSNSTWNKTIYDPYANMLRTTTETMSSLIGGVDSMAVLPFNAVYEDSTEFSERIARNQQLILKGEAHFNEVVDPAAGSYYVENLTDQLIKKAWDLFLEVDELGGYIEALKQGFIQKKIREEADIKNNKIAQRRQSILGTNQFPNINEQLDNIAEEVLGQTDQSSNEYEALPAYRAAQAFENLRYQTDQYSKNNKRPSAWMFTYGNLAMRKARSQFAGNFFGCAGYEVVDNPGFKTLEDGIAAAKKDKPEIIVLCSSDAEYADIAIHVYEALKDSCTIVLAGYPKELMDELKAKGLTNFIHVKSNVLEELKRYQNILGIQ